MESPYSPLLREEQQIRLLVVQAGLKDEDVRCSLQTVSLLDSPIYETISYTWCDANVRGSIQLNERITSVPASSEAAIRQVRLADRDRTIWIDAICIDQDKVAERGHQVGIMDKIYESGKLNLIYLRDVGECAEDVSKTVEAILQDARKETNHLRDLGKTLYENMRVSHFSSTPLSGSIKIEPLLKFLSNPWFRRKWVIQEAALAPDSVCLYNESSMPLIDVLQACAWLGYKYVASGITWSDDFGQGITMFDIVDREHAGDSAEQSQKPDLLSYLLGGEFAASEPRDHVFGIIGLYKRVIRGHPSALQPPDELTSPDYSKSIAEIFTAATRFSMMEWNNLDFLRYVERFANAADHAETPSRGGRSDEVQRFRPGGDESYGKSADDGIEMCKSAQADDPMILTRSGWIVTTVSDVTSISTSVADLKPLEAQAGIYSSAKTLIESGPKEQRDSHNNLLAITLSGGLDWSRRAWSLDEANNAHQLLEQYLQKEGRSPQPCYEYADLPQEDRTRQAAEYNSRVVVAHRFRRAFLTAGSSLGLGPSATRIGDVVVVLYGVGYPAVLRPRPDLPDGNHYEFIGLCYDHGLMDGAATRAYRANGGKDVTFKLV